MRNHDEVEKNCTNPFTEHSRDYIPLRVEDPSVVSYFLTEDLRLGPVFRVCLSVPKCLDPDPSRVVLVTTEEGVRGRLGRRLRSYLPEEAETPFLRVSLLETHVFTSDTLPGT